ncbi:MAG: hypothetical protein WC690_01395 [bacterium]
MGDPIDVKKHCSSFVTEALRRSCEFLAEDCNEQQKRNASRYVLVGPDNSTKTMSSAGQCFKESIAIPKKSGPLPASRLAQRKQASAGQQPPPDPRAAYARCDANSASGSAQNDSCKAAVNVCLSRPQGPYTLDTDRGPFLAQGQASCIDLASTLSKLNYRVTGGSTPLPPQPAQSQSKPQTQASSATPEPPKANQGGNAGGGKAVCKRAGSPGSESNRRCEQLSRSCSSSPSGPYTLDTNRGPFKAEGQQSCFDLASSLASMGYEQNSAAQAEPNAPGPIPPSNPQAQGQPQVGELGVTRFIKPFGDVNIRLRVMGGRIVEERRTLLFEGVKGIQINIRYSSTWLQPGRCRLSYTIFNKDGNQIGDPQTLDFGTSGNQINLGFEVALYSAGNFGSVKSVRVISL